MEKRAWDEGCDVSFWLFTGMTTYAPSMSSLTLSTFFEAGILPAYTLLFEANPFKTQSKPKPFLFFPSQQSAKSHQFWNKLDFILCKCLQATIFVWKVVSKGRQRKSWSGERATPSAAFTEQLNKGDKTMTGTRWTAAHTKIALSKNRVFEHVLDPVCKCPTWFYLFTKTNLKDRKTCNITGWFYDIFLLLRRWLENERFYTYPSSLCQTQRGHGCTARTRTLQLPNSSWNPHRAPGRKTKVIVGEKNYPFWQQPASQLD